MYSQTPALQPIAPSYHLRILSDEQMMPGITHPRTGAYLSSSTIVYAIRVELAHMWGVPTLAGTFGGDAPQPGSWKVGEGTGAMMCALCGAETGSGMGLQKGSTVLYPEGLVLDAEIYHDARETLAGIDLGPEELALDVIDEVGPRGHFLRQRHTRHYMRKLGYPELTAQPTPEGGYRDPIEVAREKTNWILENHHPEPLDQAQQEEFKRILRAAGRELG